MKCKSCNGTGKIKAINFAKPDWKDTEKVCPVCGGTGKVEQTNDEWRRTCSAEEFAEWLFHYSFDKCNLCGQCWDENVCPQCERRSDKDFFEKWLKGKHEESE